MSMSQRILEYPSFDTLLEYPADIRFLCSRPLFALLFAPANVIDVEGAQYVHWRKFDKFPKEIHFV